MTTKLTRALAHALAPAALLSACTLDAGHGFATLEDGTLDLHFVPSRKRQLDEDTFLTAHGCRVQLSQLRVYVDHVRLLGVRTDGMTDAPDDTHCHDDHCHDESDDHEDEQEAHADGDEELAVLATLPIERDINLLAMRSVALDRFEPSRELPQGTLERVELSLSHFHARGQIEGCNLPASVALDIDFPLHAPLSHTLSLPLDREGPETITPVLSIRLDGSLLDYLNLPALAQDGLVSIDESSPEKAALL